MKTRVLAGMVVVAVLFAAVPAFAGHPRRAIHKHGWGGPVVTVPPVVRHYHPPVYRPPVYVAPRYRPPVYVAPRVVPRYLPPRHVYGAPGYYYDDTHIDIGLYRGGLGLHIGF